MTSPAIEFDLKRQADPKQWLYRAAYARSEQLWNMEIGSFQNVRFVRTPKLTLWNAGAVTYQTTVTSPIAAGDGAPSGLVDNSRRAGQAGATHYIQLDSGTDMTQYAVNDKVTVHVLRGDGSKANITNGGVDWTDGTLQNLRIVSINSGSHRLTFNQPIMTPFDTDLGGGVYAYVTKGVHIHASIFLGGPDAVAVGIGRPMELHFPPPVDNNSRTDEQLSVKQFENCWNALRGSKATTQRESADVTALKTSSIGQSAAEPAWDYSRQEGSQAMYELSVNKSAYLN